jgi:TP901 family phage tail tape measure protein
VADNTILIKIQSKVDKKGFEETEEGLEKVRKKAKETEDGLGGAKKGAEDAGKGMEGLGKSSDDAAGKVEAGKEVMIGAFRFIGEAAVAGIGLAIQKFGEFGIGSVKMASDFQQQMSGVQAVLGGTAEDNQQLTDLALDLGATTSYSAQEAAQGLEILAANGLSTKDIIDGAAKATLDLAAATGGSLDVAASTMTDTMSIFGISAKDAGEAINGIAGVTVASKYDIQDYAMALAQGGAVAAASGVSFEDFNTSITTLSPLFASGADAGTSFKTMLSRLYPASGPAAKAMAEVGLLTEDGSSKFYDAAGNLKSMAEVAQIMQDAFGGLSEEQRTAAMSTIFGSDAMRAAIGFMRAGGDAFETTAEKIGEVSAADQAAIRLDNFAGAMEALNGAIDTLKITIGTELLPMLTTLINDYLQPIVGAIMSAVKAFKDGEDPVLAFAAALAEAGWTDIGIQIMLLRRRIVDTFGWLMENKEGIVAAVLAFRAVIVGAAVPSMIVSLRALAAATWTAVAPLLPLYAGAAAVAYIAYVVAENWGEITAAFDAAGGGLAGFVAALGVAFDAILGPVDEFVYEMAIAFGSWAAEAWTNMSTALGIWWIEFQTWINATRYKIVDAVSEWISDFTSWVSETWYKTKEGVGVWWIELLTWINATRYKIADAVSGWIDSFIGWVVGIWTAMTTPIGEWWNSLMDWIKSRPEAMKEAVMNIGRNLISYFADGILAAPGKIFDTLMSVVQGAWQGVMSWMTGGGQATPAAGQTGGAAPAPVLGPPAAPALPPPAATRGGTNVTTVNNYTYSPTYGGSPNIAGDATLVRSLAGSQ